MNEMDATETCPTSSRGFHIAHLNVRSMNNKLLELYSYVRNLKFDVFTISETWLNEAFPEELLYIDGYNLLRLDRSWKEENVSHVKKGGGLAIYIKQDLHVSLDKLKKFNVSTKNIEVQWVEVNMENSRNIIIGNIYRPPQGDINTCCDFLTDTVNDIVLANNADIFLLGDFNVDYFDKGSVNYKSLHKFEMLTNLKQLIQNPTRSDHCIDLIYTNSDFIAKSGVLPLLLSDHELIYATRKKSKTKYNRVQFVGRSYRNYNKEELREYLNTKDWTEYFNKTNPSDCWDMLLQSIETKIDNMCPLKQRTVRDKNEPWLSNEIIEAIYDKDKAWKKAKKTKNPEDIITAKALRNEVKNMIRAAKANFVQDYCTKPLSTIQCIRRYVKTNSSPYYS